MSERRRADRYPVVVPVRAGNIRAETRDVSTTGFYFQCTDPLEVGAHFDGEIELPALFPLEAGRLRFHATIVRVDRQEDGQLGIGASCQGWFISD